MTVYRDKFLVNKTNRCTEIQFYWYYDFTCFGQPFCPSSGVLSRTSACHPTPGSIRSSELHKMYQSRYTAKNSWWWAERLPETCRVVIPIKLDFSAYIGFVHKAQIQLIHKSLKTSCMFRQQVAIFKELVVQKSISSEDGNSVPKNAGCF